MQSHRPEQHVLLVTSYCVYVMYMFMIYGPYVCIRVSHFKKRTCWNVIILFGISLTSVGIVTWLVVKLVNNIDILTRTFRCSPLTSYSSVSRFHGFVLKLTNVLAHVYTRAAGPSCRPCCCSALSDEATCCSELQHPSIFGLPCWECCPCGDLRTKLSLLYLKTSFR